MTVLKPVLAIFPTFVSTAYCADFMDAKAVHERRNGVAFLSAMSIHSDKMPTDGISEIVDKCSSTLSMIGNVHGWPSSRPA